MDSRKVLHLFFCGSKAMLFRRNVLAGCATALAFCCCLPISNAFPIEELQTTAGSAPQAVGEFEQGGRWLRRGDFAEAAASFEAAMVAAGKEGKRAEKCEAAIMLAQSITFTGQYRKALDHLEKALPDARERGDKRQTAAVLGAMGNAELGMGNVEDAHRLLNEGLVLARMGGFDNVAASILNNLGNLSMVRKEYRGAAGAYRESAALAEKGKNASLAASAIVNGATAASRGGSYGDAYSILDQGRAQLRGQEDSSGKAYALINGGLLLAELRSRLPGQDQKLAVEAHAAFTDALTVALAVGDARGASYALGYLGKLYEDGQQYPEALQLTERAISAAQRKNITEALYRWHWQAGRILGRLGRLDQALASYRHSLRTLQSIREEMASCYATSDSSYQKTASTVCAELIDLLLQRASKLTEGESAEPYLVEARETLEALKVFELRDYFKDDCVDAARTAAKKLDDVSKSAVVIYPILLPDRVELLASFSGRLKRFTLPVGAEELTKEIREFRTKLVKRTTWEFLPHAQKLYDWIIRPLEKDLEAMKGDTLVFVPDGALRSIPMAALHDGTQFLISRFPIAITPSLNLTDPRPMKKEHSRILSLGLTRAVQGFPGLPYVSDELKAVQGLYGGHHLVDEDFRLVNVEQELKKEPFSIIHIASHGQFGGDIDKTFLLAFDEKFTMNRFGEYVGLYRFREDPLDLLTLSACETAAGDDRAALGLAGVAVRAGARSAVATLWHVNDPASFELIAEFYRQLQTGSVSRAAALQAAQQKLLGDIRYDHPGYWAPFLLINNWL